ncbi:hypothetical protein [uncultured Rhodospira sp.]|uniref:hypothetical protein n=1 Tax=uncultured Rhodospira sp. TaxID=1936189 RepID=UPI002610CF6C|nr:hypothetical protein [uncultured Rhodospira sp.]
MDGSGTSADPLLRGFYTVSDAARLLGIARKDRIRRWLGPANDSARPPVVLRDYSPDGGPQELSFLDLIEVRFVEHFRSKGFSLQFLRKVAQAARKYFGARHPFALSHAKYLTDRKNIFRLVADEERLSISNILTGQLEMYDIIEKSLAADLTFDPVSCLATAWRPRPDTSPNVVVNPRYAFGQPTIGPDRVPTAALRRQFDAEDGDVARVASWWEVEPAFIREAVAFERELAA